MPIHVYLHLTGLDQDCIWFTSICIESRLNCVHTAIALLPYHAYIKHEQMLSMCVCRYEKFDGMTESHVVVVHFVAWLYTGLTPETDKCPGPILGLATLFPGSISTVTC